MRQLIRAAALTCVTSAIVLTGSACGGDNHAAPSALTPAPGIKLNGDFSDAGGEIPGALAAANTLPTIDRRLLVDTSLAARLTYTSTSGINDGAHPQVTGTVFVPNGQPPAGGWPIVAFGHPETGILPECAPSLSPTLLGSSATVETLVDAGYVVTVPDYQGLGITNTYHPFLDSTTVGYNLIDSVRAARKLVPNTSTRWVALGISQGGQAAWAANELAENYGWPLTLLGSVSVSPTADINGFADAAAAGELTNDQQLTLQLILASLKKEYPDFDLDDYRRGIVEEQWDLLSGCRDSDTDDRARVADQITADDLRPASADAVATLHGYLQKMSLPQGPTVAPMLVVFGGKDALIPAAWTQRALDRACKMGDVIQIQLQPDQGRDQIDLSTAFAWIAARFNGDPPVNNCAPPPAPASALEPPATESPGAGTGT